MQVNEKLKNAIHGNRLVTLGIKYIPVVATSLIVVHITLLLLDIYEPFTIWLSAFLLVALLSLLSIRFGFCRLHKCMSLYMALASLCIMLQKLDLFGRTLTLFRALMLGLGLFLLGWLIKKGPCCGQ